MQRLPEASDRRRVDACTRKRGPSQQREEFHSLSAVTNGVPAPGLFLQTGGGHHAFVFR